MIKKLIKNKLFIILIILLIIFLIIKITTTNQTSSNSNQKSIQTNSVSSKSNPQKKSTSSSNQTHSSISPTPTIKITEINYQIPLYNLLPYQGKYFRAVRYIAANNLEIIVPIKNQTDLAKKEVQDWLVKNSVDKIDTFTIVYK